MNDPVAAFLRLAEIPRENLSEVETFLGTQKTDSAALAVLERPDEPVALLKVDRGGEATLFSVVPAEHGSRLLHETYIGKVPDATVTQIHAIESLGGASAPQPERVEITGSRLMGQIDLTNYDGEQRATLIDALRMITDPRS
jgi:hypothetical protein